MKNYYKILGILDDAEDIIIRAAYKALAQKYHPDKWSGDAKDANRRMSEINEAYEVLSEKEKREKYDSEYFSTHQRHKTPNYESSQKADAKSEENSNDNSNKDINKIFRDQRSAFKFVRVNLLSLIAFLITVYFLYEVLNIFGQKNIYIQAAYITEPVFFAWCLIIIKIVSEVDSGKKPLFGFKLVTYVLHIVYMMIILFFGTFMANFLK